MDLLRVCAVLVGEAVKLAYDAWTCSRMPYCVICACRVGWTRVEVLVGFLGSLRCGVSTGRSSVVLRVSRHFRSCVSKPWRFLFGSLANIASVCCL
jgi:hypothetical protein